ncbi:hypothetical protein BHW_0900019 (plasmid) [Borrelia hermsii MTW]|uniref:Uncharacterized protein n=1 Tax=Borrelia hermsii MTW TaxID=1313291 RepID=W5T592_BORHE|nr:hypothetical protein BHW_0900019 [Borrelia hermsii MTW]
MTQLKAMISYLKNTINTFIVININLKINPATIDTCNHKLNIKYPLNQIFLL